MCIIMYKMFKSKNIGFGHPAIITFIFFITIYDPFLPILAMLTVSLLQSLGT